MRTQVVELDRAIGKLLTVPIFQNGSGKKLLAKGHLISEEDIQLLLTTGHNRVAVAELEDGDIAEEEAALAVASESACGSMEIHMAAGGRANLVTTEDSCLLVDHDLLREVNSSGCLTTATLPNLAFARAQQRVATVKSAPFAVPRSELQRVIQSVRQRGPILQARPIRNPAIGVLYTDACTAERSRLLFEGIMKTRLERLRAAATYVLSAIEDEVAVARGLEILLRALVTAAIELSSGLASGGGWEILYQSVFSLVWQLVGSVALGALVGMMVAGWATKVTERGETLILLVGAILLTVGAARILDLSELVASLAVGGSMVNLSRRSRRLFDALAGTHPPFYAIFFVIAGASMQVNSVSNMGALGIGYLVARTAGKIIGARWGATRAAMPARVRQYLGYGLLAQAGLAVGLTLVVDRQFPDFSPAVSVVVLASVVIYEIIGPIGTRFAVVRAGEARYRKTQAESIWA